jgi:hypothetical protein
MRIAVGPVGSFPRALSWLTYREPLGEYQNCCMVESAKYGITAVRYAGTQVVEAMMGLFDATQRRWESHPPPTPGNEGVDQLVEGDTIISLFPDDAGGLEPGPEVKVDVLAEGTETLALAEEPPGRSLKDLPRF